MEVESISTLADSRLRVKTSLKDSSVQQFETDVFYGLTSKPKRLSPKYFYDEEGSKLFEEICDLPEYYPTRTEHSIIEARTPDIAELAGPEAVLIEFGSGSSTKTRAIIEAFLARFGRLHYIPVDISKTMLTDSAHALLRNYENLRVTGVVSDYVTALQLLNDQKIKNRFIIFLGSSIGNFTKNEARDFLRRVRDTMQPNDHFLLGMDMVKSEETLLAAYDDVQGVTAAFNMNLLTRINRELGGSFDLTKFRHKILFNPEESRIEMHLESTVKQEVAIHGISRTINFEQGETIHTENSYKFSKEQIRTMVQASGFELEKTWYDQNEWFSLNVMKPAPR